MLPVLLRPCRPADATALARIDAGVVEVVGDSGPGWHAAAADDPARVHLVLDDRTGSTDTADIDDTDDTADPAGYLVLAAPRGPEPGVELHRLVIAPGRRRTGLGRALLGTALALAAVPAAPTAPGDGHGTGAPLGVDPGWVPPPWLPAGRIWLEVAPDNAAALRLYRSAGLVTETRLPSVPGDPESAPLRLVLSRG